MFPRSSALTGKQQAMLELGGARIIKIECMSINRVMPMCAMPRAVNGKTKNFALDEKHGIDINVDPFCVGIKREECLCMLAPPCMLVRARSPMHDSFRLHLIDSNPIHSFRCDLIS